MRFDFMAQVFYRSQGGLSKCAWFACLAAALFFVPAGAPLAADAEDLPPYVAAIVFHGNESIPDGELRSVMRTRQPRMFQFSSRPRYVRDWLRSDLATIEAYYHRAGFYEVAVISLREGDLVFDEETFSVSIHIRVEEGKRRYARHLSIESDHGQVTERLRRRLSFKPGEPFNPQTPGIDQFRALRAMQEQGYFSAQVRYETEIITTPAHLASDSLDLSLVIRRGPAARVGELRLQGHSLPENLILRELTVKVGEPLKLADILDSKQNLFDTGYFRFVDYKLEEMTDAVAAGEPVVPLRLTWIFRERKLAAIEGGVGVGTIDGLRLLGNWSHRNLLNRGQRLTFEAKLSLKDDSQGDFGVSYQLQSLDYRFLYIVRLRAQLSLLLFRENDYEQETRATSLETRAIRLTATRRLDPFTMLRLREQFDFLHQRTLSDLVVESEPRTLTRSLTLVLDRDRRNHYFSPTRGGQDLLSYELAGGIQGGDHHFHRVQASRSSHGPVRSSIFATRLFIGGVWAYGNSKRDPQPGIPRDGVPYEERFYCGGGSTVRGYDEGSLGPRLAPGELQNTAGIPGQNLPDYIRGGRFIAVANLEYRKPFSLFGKRVFQSVLFLDGGNTWQDLSEISGASSLPWQGGESADLSRVFWGCGAGFRYVTPLTVVRIDYGIPLQDIADGGSRWHISLGQTF